MAFLKAIKPLFPFSYREKTGKDLALSIIIYVVIEIVATVILGILVALTQFIFGLIAMGWLASIVVMPIGLLISLVNLYALGGIAMSILHFTGVLDKANGTKEEEKKEN